MTVRHLVTMSSGLATDDAWADRHLDLHDDELDAIVADGVTFSWMPGVTFEYSNLGYGVLGRVVRNITGSTLQRHVTDHLLEPLGMTRTSWTAPDDAVTGYRTRPDDGGALVAEPMVGDGAIAPMGGLFSSVTDLARWVDFFASAFGSPHAAHDAVLGTASRREMQQVAHAHPAERSATTGAWSQYGGGYGYGLQRAPPPDAGHGHHPQRRSARLRFEHAVGRRAPASASWHSAIRRTARWRPRRTRCSMPSPTRAP